MDARRADADKAGHKGGEAREDVPPVGPQAPLPYIIMQQELVEDAAPLARGTYGTVTRATLCGAQQVVVKRPRLDLCRGKLTPTVHRQPLTRDMSHETCVNMTVSRRPHPHIVRFLGLIYKNVDQYNKYHDVSVVYGLVFERWEGTFGQLLRLAHSGDDDDDATAAAHLVLPAHDHAAAWLRLLLRALVDALHGVMHLHSLGFAHCDLSPGNVLWRPRSGARRGSGDVEGAVADLGQATPIAVQNRRVKSDADAMLHHLPEACEMRGPATDVFSAGALLHAIGARATQLCSADAALASSPSQYVDAYQRARACGSPALLQQRLRRMHALTLRCLGPLDQRMSLRQLCDALTDLLM